VASHQISHRLGRCNRTDSGVCSLAESTVSILELVDQQSTITVLWEPTEVIVCPPSANSSATIRPVIDDNGRTFDGIGFSPSVVGSSLLSVFFPSSHLLAHSTCRSGRTQVWLLFRSGCSGIASLRGGGRRCSRQQPVSLWGLSLLCVSHNATDM